MREILFRGKNVLDGTWHYGSLQTFKGFSIFDTDWKNWNAVRGATVGQYTGLTDCVGKKIFEGDIFVDMDNQCVGVVEWCHGGFNINWYGKGGLMMEYGYDECAGEWGLFETEPCSEIYVDKLEVVGNIHDNPDLLKEEK